jgi:HlyD family secretion protein
MNIRTPEFSDLHGSLSVYHLLVILLWLGPAMAVRAQPPGIGGGPSPVIAAPVIQRQVAAGQTYVASVNPLRRAVIGSAVDGRVVNLMVDEGDRVNTGQPIAQLLTATIELELRVAEAELKLRLAELEELRNGALPDEIEQSRAKMQAAKANLEYAQTGFERMQTLLNKQAIAQGDYDAALALLHAAEQGFLDAKAAYDLTIAGPRAERILQAEARMQNQQATIELIKDRIEKFTVTSRFDGYVVAKFTEAGSWLRSGDPVMELVALDEVEIRAFVSEQHIPFARLGMEVRVEIPALPDQLFTGFIASIIPQADSRARTFPVNVRVKNQLNGDGPMLKAGMYARVELPTGNVQKSLMVPKDAIVLGGPNPIVFVIDKSPATGSAGRVEGGKVRPVPVQLGVAQGQWISVLGNLNDGQLVVVEGNERLRPEQVVSIKDTREAPPLESFPAPGPVPNP